MISTNPKAPEKEKEQRCKVLKAFFVKGEAVKVGENISLPLGLAHELKDCNKLKFVVGKADSEPGPGKQTN